MRLCGLPYLEAHPKSLNLDFETSNQQIPQQFGGIQANDQPSRTALPSGAFVSKGI